MYNFTCGNDTSLASYVLGGELCVWDDAAQTDSGDLWMSVTPYMIGVSEPWWSPQSMTSGVSPDENRAHAHRCRMAARGIASHPIFWYGTFCPFEYVVPLPMWGADKDQEGRRKHGEQRMRGMLPSSTFSSDRSNMVFEVSASDVKGRGTWDAAALREGISRKKAADSARPCKQLNTRDVEDGEARP